MINSRLHFAPWFAATLCAPLSPLGCPAALSLMLAPHEASADAANRNYQHGVNFVPTSESTHYLIWSSSGNPPNGKWTHDIYSSTIRLDKPTAPPEPTTLVSNDEAQEPASSAISAEGTIMITMEDGWNTKNTIAQRYGVYDSNLDPVLPYPQLVLDGGHSGHVAAAGNRFVIFYSEGWTDGGGVDNLGSGDNVWASIYDSRGGLLHSVPVATGTTRDWWPLVAGGSATACLLWQRFVPQQTYAQLVFTVLDVQRGTLRAGPNVLHQTIEYYTYAVESLPTLDRFVVTGALFGGGAFSYLIDEEGNVVADLTDLPHGIVRESSPAVKQVQDAVLVAYPIQPSGLMVLRIASTSIALHSTIEHHSDWGRSGTDGVFLPGGGLLFATLSPDGVRMSLFEPIETPDESDTQPANTDTPASPTPSLPTQQTDTNATPPVTSEDSATQNTTTQPGVSSDGNAIGTACSHHGSTSRLLLSCLLLLFTLFLRLTPRQR